MIELPPIYGALALSRIGMQIGTASLERDRKIKKRRYFPKATLVIAVYNEPIKVFREAAQSFKDADYPNLEVIVVDDGSRNRKYIRAACEKLNFKYIFQKNAGKREAMFNAFSHMSPDSKVILATDSDTVWDRQAAKQLVTVLLNDKKTGAVTGEVGVSNENDNLLTKLIGLRYHMAFQHERASQSYFGLVTCISGPLGAYRREVIDQIKDKFIAQRFLGQKCTYGDDRHLTNLVLNAKYKVRYAPKAVCYTQAPTKLRELLRQQNRWSKSYWREMVWQLRVLPKHGPYLTYDWIVGFMLPFILAIAISWHLTQIGGGEWIHIWLLLGTIVGMSAVRVIEPMIRTRRPIFLIFGIYGLIYFALMLPLRFYALATITDHKWGTR